MKLIIYLSMAISLAGCIDKEPTYSDSPENYRCTDAELDTVQKEFLVCDQSGYFSSYCFLQAKKTICSPIDAQPETKQ